MPVMDVTSWSPRRAELASFEHAYAVALRRCHHSGRGQFILRTGNPWQPYLTTGVPPAASETILAIIV